MFKQEQRTKEEAEKLRVDLKNTNDDLQRLNLEYEDLFKQAEEASRYKTISNDIKKNEALLTFLKIQEINKELKESQEGLNEIDDDISAVTIEKNYSTELLDNENKRIKPLRNDFAEITSKLQRLNLEYEDLFKQEQRTKEVRSTKGWRKSALSDIIEGSKKGGLWEEEPK